MSSIFPSYKPIWLHEDDPAPADQQAAAPQQQQQPNPDDQFDIDTSGKSPEELQQQQAAQAPQDGEAQPEAVDPNQPVDDGSAQQDQMAAQDNMDNPAKQIDRQIFASLSPQEQQIKILKLKELFSDLYDNINQIIKKYDTLGIEYEEFSDPIKKSLSVLYDLKDMLSTYILYLFDSKSYVENDIMFNRYLTVLNTIKNATDELRDIKSDEIEAVLHPKQQKNYSPIYPSTIITQ